MLDKCATYLASLQSTYIHVVHTRLIRKKIFHQVEKQTSHNMYSLLAYWDRVAGGQILMTAHLFPVMKQSWSCLLFSTPSRSNRIKQSPACYYKENSIIFSYFEVRESYLQLVSVSSTAPICHVFRPLQDQKHRAEATHKENDFDFFLLSKSADKEKKIVKWLHFDEKSLA